MPRRHLIDARLPSESAAKTWPGGNHLTILLLQTCGDE